MAFKKVSVPLAIVGALYGVGVGALTEQQVLNRTYDYVIVGGGTSGLTVANRLTASGKHTVLVIDAGELNNDPSLLIPYDTLNFHPDRFYNITSQPIAGLNNITASVLAGAVVGGGSAVNGMFFDRGAASDYDAWEALGNPGWSFADLLPYFKKSVTFTPPTPEVAEAYNYTWDIPSAYGGNGEIQVSFPPYQFPGQGPVWDGFRELGIPKPKEAANGNAIGAIMAPSALDPVSRTRSYARTAHYDPFRNRTNYQLLTGHQATEILFSNSTTLRATGVNFIKKGSSTKLSVHASREVIVAAGAIWTPWLLQRSGIGPSSLLSRAGIPIIHDLPGVGANFQDHPIGGGVWNWSSNPFSPMPNDLLTNPSFLSTSRQEYELTRTGPLTPARGNQAAFVTLQQVAPELWKGLVDAISTQNATPYLPSSYDTTLTAGYLLQQNLTATLLSQPDSAAFEFPFGAGPLGSGVLMRPLSRGTVGVDALNLDAAPIVHFNTFANPLDVTVAAQILPFVRKFNGLARFADFSPVELAPGKNTSSAGAVEAYLRSSFAPTFAHPAGTASMMPLEYGGVVDTELKVHGVSGLRVVDASVIPYLPATHICTTVYAVAEKAAEMVLGDVE